MLHHLIVFAVAMLATHLAHPLSKIMGRRMSAWDQPDQLSQENHYQKVLRTGGIAIFIGLNAGALAHWVLRPEAGFSRYQLGVTAGSGLIFITGLLDDLHEIKPWLKAVFQAVGCLVMAMIAPIIPLTGLVRLDFVLVILILFSGVNAFNLMDGLDGLASGMFIAALAGFLVLGLAGNDQGLVYTSVIGIGAAAGFLLVNRPSARIYMGDSGSLVLGFMLTLSGLMLAGGGPKAMVSAALVLSPFILDTGTAIFRRALRHTDLFTGDRQHIYDILYRRHRSAWRTDLEMWTLGLGFSGLGLAVSFLPLAAGLAALACSWLGLILWMVNLGMFREERPKGRVWTREMIE